MHEWNDDNGLFKASAAIEGLEKAARVLNAKELHNSADMLATDVGSLLMLYETKDGGISFCARKEAIHQAAKRRIFCFLYQEKRAPFTWRQHITLTYFSPSKGSLSTHTSHFNSHCFFKYKQLTWNLKFWKLS